MKKKGTPYKGKYSIALYDREGCLAALFDTTAEFIEYKGVDPDEAYKSLWNVCKGTRATVEINRRRMIIKLIEMENEK